MSTDAGFQVTLYFGVIGEQTTVSTFLSIYQNGKQIEFAASNKKIDFLLDLSEALDGMSELRDCHPSEVAIKGIYELIKKVPTIKGIIMVEYNIVIGQVAR